MNRKNEWVRWAIFVVAVLAAITIILLIATSGQAQTTEPTYVSQVEVEFRDGTRWATTQPAWSVVVTRSDGIANHQVFLAAAPATKPAPIESNATMRLRDNSTVENTIFDVSGQEGIAAMHVTGTNVTITNVESRGTSMALLMQGAKHVRVDGLKSLSGKMNDKFIYSGGALNDDIVIKNFEAFLPAPRDTSAAARYAAAEHGIRFHGWKNITLENGVVDYRNYMYKGAAMTVHEPGDGLVVRNVRFLGPVGIGNLPVNFGKPGWDSMRTQNILFDHCEINTPNWFQLEPGTMNVEVRDSTIRAVKWPADPDAAYELTPSGTCLNIRSARPPWPAANGQFVRVKFEGTALYTAETVGNLGQWKFIDCTFNGKPISESGKPQ